MKTLIELLVTCLFCVILYKFGGIELNWKLVIIGFVLWLLGYIDGRADKKGGAE